MTNPPALRLAATVAALCLALSACNRPAGESGTLRIAVVPKGANHVFWQSVHAGARKAARELDGVRIEWKGPVSEGDVTDQIEIVDNFIADGVDGLCLAPSDKTALRKPVETAMAAGIPVVVFDSGLSSHEGIVSYVATDNYAGGRRAGEKLAQLLDGEGDVILLRYEIGSESTEQREEGFLDALAQYEGIRLLSSDKHAGPDESGAIEVSESLLLKYGDEVDGIFCPNESSASGMLTALRNHPGGLAGKVKFVGFDTGDNIVSGLEAGHMHATVLQDPVTMGYLAVKTMHAHLQGEPVEAEIKVPGGLATPENMNDPDIARLLKPDVAD